MALIVLALLVALDVAAWLWGHDSRDGRDWMARTSAPNRGRDRIRVDRIAPTDDPPPPGEDAEVPPAGRFGRPSLTRSVAANGSPTTKGGGNDARG